MKSVIVQALGHININIIFINFIIIWKYCSDFNGNFRRDTLCSNYNLFFYIFFYEINPTFMITVNGYDQDVNSIFYFNISELQFRFNCFWQVLAIILDGLMHFAGVIIRNVKMNSFYVRLFFFWDGKLVKFN